MSTFSALSAYIFRPAIQKNFHCFVQNRVKFPNIPANQRSIGIQLSVPFRKNSLGSLHELYPSVVNTLQPLQGNVQTSLENKEVEK